MDPWGDVEGIGLGYVVAFVIAFQDQHWRTKSRYDSVDYYRLWHIGRLTLGRYPDI